MMPTQKMIRQPIPPENVDWWDTFHDDNLIDSLLGCRSSLEIQTSLDFIIRNLNLKEGDRIFDQCCGIGSLSLPLSEMGYQVIGVDRSHNYINKAIETSVAMGGNGDYFDADAAKFVCSPSCHGAFNWWTCLGYDDKLADLNMLRSAHDSLLPGGRLLIDTMNVPGVIQNFIPHHEKEYTVGGRPRVLIRNSTIDLKNGRLEKDWIYKNENEECRHHSSVRLILPWELESLLLEAGFSDVDFMGDLDESELQVDSPRCIALARRKL